MFSLFYQIISMLFLSLSIFILKAGKYGFLNDYLFSHQKILSVRVLSNLWMSMFLRHYLHFNSYFSRCNTTLTVVAWSGCIAFRPIRLPSRPKPTRNAPADPVPQSHSKSHREPFAQSGRVRMDVVWSGMIANWSLWSGIDHGSCMVGCDL